MSMLSGQRMALGSLLAAALFAGCGPSEEESDYLAHKAVLLRQNQGIREIIAAAEHGSLVPADSFLVGIDEKVVADLVRSQLPLERPLGKRFIVHLDRATVLLRDKYGLVTIEGNIHRPGTPERRTAVRLLGGLGAVEIDPKTDLLRLNIALDQVDLLEAGALDKMLGRGSKKFIAQHVHAKMQNALPPLQIPVVLAQQIRVPAIHEGAIQLDSLLVPLNLSVERVLAAHGKLWLTLHAEVGKVIGAEQGLGVAVKKKVRRDGDPAPGMTTGQSPGERGAESPPPGSKDSLGGGR